MAKQFTKIPSTLFADLQINAGVIAKTFDPTGVVSLADADIICATTGGINATCVPEYADLGEDIDNCAKNTKELKILTGWDCKMGFTALSATADIFKMALGASDATGDKITPRSELQASDFQDLWFVGDKAGGGFVAIKLANALSDAGFSLQTSDKGKGQLAVSVTGHVSISAQDTVPMEFYISE